MVSLLKLFSARAPDATAFDNSDLQFRIAGGHVYFDRIRFRGDAISLVGQGVMDRDHRIEARFRTVVGRDEFRIPVLSEILGQAGDQILQVYVGGTLSDPIVRQDVLPGVNQALQQLQQGMTGNLPPSQRGRIPPPQRIRSRFR